MENIIAAIVKAANEKFGEVLNVNYKGDNCYFVACKRQSCPWADRPYMTITASVSNHTGKGDACVGFFWGHYDLTLESLNKAILAHPVAA